MVVEKLLAGMILIENQLDAVIAGLPGIDKEVTARRFKVLCILISQKVESLSQRSAPTLIPTRFTSGVTATIADPTTNAVRAAPGSSFPVRALVNFNVHCASI